MGKGENAGNQHFLFFPQCFQRPSSEGSLQIRIVWQWFKGFFYLFQHKIYTLNYIQKKKMQSIENLIDFISYWLYLESGQYRSHNIISFYILQRKS